MHCLKFICIVFIFFVKIVSSDSVDSVELNYKSQNYRTSTYQEGIFEKFVRAYLDVLKGIRGKRMRNYCRMANRQLRDLGYKYTRRLGRIFKNWAGDDEEAAEEIANYRREYENKLPRRTAFFKAMNDVFTYQQAVLFSDYIYELTNYGNGLKHDIDTETQKLFNDVILNNIHKLSKTDKDALEKKLKKAIKEYETNEGDDYLKDLLNKKHKMEESFKSLK